MVRELAGVRTQRGGQAEAVEDRRAQFAREPAHEHDGVVDERLHAGDPGRDGRAGRLVDVPREAASDPAEIHLQARERLAQRVVKLAGDAAALGLDRGRQRPGVAREARAGFPGFALGRPLRRDVLQDRHEVRRRAVFRFDPRGRDHDRDDAAVRTQVALLAREAAAAGPGEFGKAGVLVGPVVRMGEGAERAGEDLRLGAADDLAEARVHAQQPTVECALRDAEGCLIVDRREPFPRGGELGIRRGRIVEGHGVRRDDAPSGGRERRP